MNQVRDLRYAGPRPARVGQVPRPARAARDAARPATGPGAGRTTRQVNIAARRPTARPPAAKPGAPRPRRRAALTLLGVGALNVVLSCVGAALDMLATNSVEVIFGFLFTVGSLATVWLVRRADLIWSLVVPPIGYVAGLAVAVQLGANQLGASMFTKIASVLTLLALDPVPLFVGMVVAVLAVVARVSLRRG
jgi:hypothetical protein